MKAKRQTKKKEYKKVVFAKLINQKDCTKETKPGSEIAIWFGVGVLQR